MSSAAEAMREPNAYCRVKLAKLVEFRRGLTYKKRDEVDQSSNAVLRANNIDLLSGRLDLGDVRYIDATIDVPAGKKLEAGSVLICTASGSRSHLGKATYIDSSMDYAFGGFMGLLVPCTALDGKYLHYFMRSVEYWQFLEGLAGGTNINNLKFRDLGELTVPLPNIDEQKQIVAVLDQAFAALDRARDNLLHNRIAVNHIFENALAATEGEEAALGSLIKVRTGKLDANAAVEDGQYPFFTCARETYAIDTFAFDCEAILLAGNNAAGDFNVKHYRGKFNAYQRTYVITIDDSGRVKYRYLYYQLLRALKHFKESSVGAGTKFLRIGIINELKLAVPAIAKQEEAAEKLDYLSRETMRLEKLYSQKVSDVEDLRRSLLQKAFAGQLA